MLNEQKESYWITGLLPALAAGLAARIWYFLDLRVQPFFGYPVVDSLTYDRLARQILAGGGGEAFFRPPLYPFFLSTLYSGAGAGQAPVVWAQFALGLAAVVPIYLLACRWFGKAPAALAAWVTALYPLRLFFEGEILAVTLFGFLLAWGTWFFWTGSEENSLRRLLWGGLVLGLALLTRPNFLLAVPFLFGGVLLQRGSEGGMRKKLAASLAVLALAVAPAAVHNWSAEKSLIPVAANGGINFFLGNRPGATGETPLPPGLLWQDTVQEPIRAGLTGLAEQDRYWWDRSVEAVAGDPVRWVRLLSRKAVIFWNAFESSNNKDLDHFTAVSLPVRHYRGWFGALFCLGCAGLAASLRRPGALMIVSLMTGYWMAVSLFFTTARYRLPLVPFIAILAAVGVVEVVGRVRARNARGLAVMAVAGAAAAVAVFPPWFVSGEKRIDPDFQMGQIFLSRGEPEKAEEHLLRAAAARGGDPDVLNSLGAARFAKQDWQGAEEHYLAALAIGEFSEVYFNLGVVNEKMGPSRRQEAIRVYRLSLERNPLEARARANLEYLLGHSRP
jgi:hypothetical protein